MIIVLLANCKKFPFHLNVQSLEIFSIGYLKFMGIFNITVFLPNIASFMLKISVARARAISIGMFLVWLFLAITLALATKILHVNKKRKMILASIIAQVLVLGWLVLSLVIQEL